MMYQGGKTKIAEPIARLIAAVREGRTTYIEPFVGSAAVFHRVAPTFERAVGYDAMPDVILMWQAAVEGWRPPEDLSLAEYEELRAAEPSALRAFAGFPCSFGGKWFGGYARDPKSDRNFARAAARSIGRRAEAMRGAEFDVLDYSQIELEDPSGTVIYCDPPYAGTLAYAGAGAFDSGAFWTIAGEWADRGAAVLVSEYAAPAGWEGVWSVDRHTSTARDNSGRRATDRLFARPDVAALIQ